MWPSDASGTWGCGAFSSQGEWFQLEWPDSWRELHITIQELLPIVLSVALWGGQWHDSTVRCRCDNAAVVAIVNKGTSRCDKAMQLMRSLFLFTAKHNLILSAQHILGADNGAADALSRNDKNSFLIQVAGARRDPTPIPPDLLEALLHPQDWTSQSWTRLLLASWRKASQSPLTGRTAAPKTDS